MPGDPTGTRLRLKAFCPPGKPHTAPVKVFLLRKPTWTYA